MSYKGKLRIIFIKTNVGENNACGYFFNPNRRVSKNCAKKERANTIKKNSKLCPL